MENLSPEKIAKDLKNIVINLEKLKKYSPSEKLNKWLDYLRHNNKNDLYHK